LHLFTKGWFAVSKLIGWVLSIGLVVVLLGSMTGCPETKKPVTPAADKKADEKKADEKKADEKKADEKKAP
jgi:hypothetical protein